MTDAEDLLDRLREGDLRIHELEAHADHETAATARRRFLESETGADLDTIGSYAFRAAEADANVENMIGSVDVPVGVAGPLPVAGEAADGEQYLPLATTEGALVAGVNRGCSAIAAAGGATARVIERGMTRAPAFSVDGVAEAAAVAEWIDANGDRLAERAESTTSHGELLDVAPYVVGDAVYPRFVYDTKDAMGMNMATIATREAADLIESETPASLVALSGNLCSDKKPAAINAIEGRGRSVAADVEIPAEALAERFDATPGAIAEVHTRKNLVGSARAGSLGFNATPRTWSPPPSSRPDRTRPRSSRGRTPSRPSRIGATRCTRAPRWRASRSAPSGAEPASPHSPKRCRSRGWPAGATPRGPTPTRSRR